MLAEITLTPTESKFLIAKAVAQLPHVQEALKTGIIAIHPSTSGFCLFYELMGRKNAGNVWVTGMIAEKGLCIEANTQATKAASDAGEGIGKALADPGLYPHTMVIDHGKEVTGNTIYDLMEKMESGDIYVKGVNAIDANRKVGVLLGSLAEGTIGKMLSAREKKGFEILCPAGYEKLIPGSIEEASKFISGKKDYSMGQRVRLRAVDATVVTEVDAIESLAYVKAMPFASGGLEGAAGTICIAIQGERAEVEKAIAVCESVKGRQLPPVHTPVCVECGHASCHLAGCKKPWAKE